VALNAIRQHLTQGIASDSAWLPPLLEVLATATREEPFWRSLFGHPRQVHKTPSSCILEAAFLVFEEHNTNVQDDVLRPILRLIANCCADDNVSRAVLVRLKTIEALRHLALRRRASDLLLPTLYNVCIDYDEVAVDDTGEKLQISQLDTTLELTKTEQALGLYVQDQQLPRSAIELFLEFIHECGEAYYGFLGDLAELASRPALFGLQHIVGTDETLWPKRSSNVLNSLLTHGTELMAKDPDTSGSVVQTLLNVLTQVFMQKTLVKSPNELLGFTAFFTTIAQNDEDLGRYGVALMQNMYAMSALSEFGETFAPGTAAFESLTKLFEILIKGRDYSENSRLSSIIALLANTLTSPDHVSRSLEQQPKIPELVAEVIREISVGSMLVPALDLANRLALDLAGQRSFLETDIIHTLNRKLLSTLTDQGPTAIKSHTLTIHRESVALARSLIKAHPPFEDHVPVGTIDRPTFHALHTTILSLFATTLDDATKLEIGRYVVEVLRSQSLPSAASTSTSAAPTASAPTFSTLASINIVPLLPLLIHLLTASPASAGRADAVFGLGLVLSRVTTTSVAAELTPILSSREKVLAALSSIVDGASSQTEGQQGGEQRARLEQENVKMVVVQLVRALRTLGVQEHRRQRDADGVSGDDGEVGEQEYGRRELLRGLAALAARLGLQI
jgi:hypothetical protein